MLSWFGGPPVNFLEFHGRFVHSMRKKSWMMKGDVLSCGDKFHLFATHCNCSIQIQCNKVAIELIGSSAYFSNTESNSIDFTDESFSATERCLPRSFLQWWTGCSTTSSTSHPSCDTIDSCPLYVPLSGVIAESPPVLLFSCDSHSGRGSLVEVKRTGLLETHLFCTTFLQQP